MQLSLILHQLERDPQDPALRPRLVAAVPTPLPAAARQLLAAARDRLRAFGEDAAVAFLFDVEFDAEADVVHRQGLLCERAEFQLAVAADLAGAIGALKAALALETPAGATGHHARARELLEDVELEQSNVMRFVDKNVAEAAHASDRELALRMYVGAAEVLARAGAASATIEPHLRRALELEPQHVETLRLLERILVRDGRAAEAVAVARRRAEASTDVLARTSAWVAVAGYASAVGQPSVAREAAAQALAIDPACGPAVQRMAELHASGERWTEWVALYDAAARAAAATHPRDTAMAQLRAAGEIDYWIAAGDAQWKRLGELDLADETFRRVRALEPVHPAALEFYRTFYPARGETAQLAALLRAAAAALPSDRDPATEARAQAIAGELAALPSGPIASRPPDKADKAEKSPEKNIEAWKQVLRADPASAEARAALGRLYRQTEKWNALLELMKEDIERLPAHDVMRKVERWFDVVEIYRDRLRLDGMVVTSYLAILKLDPDNRRAIDELAERHRAGGRWNDLITLLARKAELEGVPTEARVALLRETADLWIERFSNPAQAIRPLERILELAPHDADALARLKDTYTRRRQWRALIGLLGKEASALRGPARHAKYAEMARLAMERVGDQRLAIEIWNQLLAECQVDESAPEALAALASLYEREKRWLALAEILRQQRVGCAPAEAVPVLERLGSVFADRLGAPGTAAQVWQEILTLDPSHGKALRTLRELLAQAGDFDGLEQLYTRLGQEDELVDAMVAIGDRTDDRGLRARVMERAAAVAARRATSSSRPDAGERVVRVWERLLAVEPHNPRAAAELAPVYARAEKWPKLLTVLEVGLAHVDVEADPAAAERLRRIDEIRALCEQKLASRSLAFSWAMRAVAVCPTDPTVRAHAVRLAPDRVAVQEWVQAFAEAGRDSARPVEARLALLRAAAQGAQRQLNAPDQARDLWREVIRLAPLDLEALREDEATSAALADWPGMLAALRAQAVAQEADLAAQLTLWARIAQVEEEHLHDLDAAVASYQAIATLQASHVGARRGLVRLHEARADWPALAARLEFELENLGVHEGMAARQGDVAPESPSGLRLRLRRVQGLAGASPELQARLALDALAGLTEVDRGGGRAGASSIAADARTAVAEVFADPQVADATRTAAALALEPCWREAGRMPELAAVLAWVRRHAPAALAGEAALDRRLFDLWRGPLAEPDAAWPYGLALFTATPLDRALRDDLESMARDLGHELALAQAFAGALDVDPPAAAPALSAERIALARALGRLADDRLGDAGLAERGWAAVLAGEPGAADAHQAMARLLRAGQRWDDLAACLTRQAEVVPDAPSQAAALRELAQLEDDVRGDAVAATAAWRQVLARLPDDPDANAAIDRLLVDQAQWGELEAFLATRQAALRDGPQTVVRIRRAALLIDRLGQPEAAIDLLEPAVARPDAPDAVIDLIEQVGATTTRVDVRVRCAELLTPAYERLGAWGRLGEALRIQRDAADGPIARTMLSARLARLAEQQLGDAPAAFAAWQSIVVADPGDAQAREAMVRLAPIVDGWPTVRAAWASIARATDDPHLAAELWGEVARWSERDGAPDEAIVAYRAQLAATPDDPVVQRAVGPALTALYTAQGRWPEVRAMLRQRTEWEPEARAETLATLAQLEEQRLGDVDAAIATWREVLAEAGQAGPGPTRDALDALERLFGGHLTPPSRPRELAELYRRRIDVVSDGGDAGPEAATEARGYLEKLANLQADVLAAPEDASLTLLELLDQRPDDAWALTRLSGLHRDGGRLHELLDLLDRRAALAGDPHTRRGLEHEAAQLLDGPLARPLEGLERWQAIIAQAPDDALARAALERAIHDPELRGRAAEVLAPLYAQTGAHAQLVELHQQLASLAQEPRLAVRHLREVASLRERALGDAPGALTAMLAACRVAVAEPDLPELLADTERLASEIGQEGALIDAYLGLAPDVLDPDLQRRLMLDAADLARGVRGDLETARGQYERVFESHPDDRRALFALESLAREQGDLGRLWHLLGRKAELVSSSEDERIGALMESADLAETRLDRADEAIAAWEQVLELAPERVDAYTALDRLYQAQSRWTALTDLVERRLGFAVTNDEAMALRVKLADLHRDRLIDHEGALEHYEAALSVDPRLAPAIAAVEAYLVDPSWRARAAGILQPIYVSQQRWAPLVAVYQIRLEAETDPDERLRLTRFVARLYEEQLEDFERALAWTARVFEEDPDDEGNREQLVRLAGIVDDWSAAVRPQRAYLERRDGDPATVRAVAISVAQIYERRLGAPADALWALGLAMAAPVDEARPSNRELLRRAEDIARIGQVEALLLPLYDQELAADQADADRRDLYARRAHLAEQLGQPDAAIRAWRDVLLACADQDVGADTAAARATSELDRLLRAQGQPAELVDIWQGAIDRARSPLELAQRRLTLGRLYEVDLADVPAAIDQYEDAMGQGGSDGEAALARLEHIILDDAHRPRVVEILEPVYRRRDWWAKLVVVLDAKLAYLDASPDKVAHLREIARLHETRGGDPELALMALARAWREDPTDGASLNDLLGLANKLGAWDQAAQIVGDGTAEVTDPDVRATLYARLAEVHEVHRGDMPAAILAWRAALVAAPEHPVALATLDRLLAISGRTDELVQIVERRAELADDAGVRLVLLHRVAALYDDVLVRPAQAIGAYRNVLAVDDTDPTAWDALERLHRAAHEPREVAAVLARKLELTDDPATTRQLRVALADVYADELHEPFEAIAQLTALPELARDDAALARLERLYATGRMWPEYVEAVDQRVALAPIGQRQAELGFAAAEIVDRELAQPEDAITRYGQVLAQLPGHAGAREALWRLSADDAWMPQAATVLAHLAHQERDGQATVRVLERRLASPDIEPEARASRWAELADAHETLRDDRAASFAVWARALADVDVGLVPLAPLERLAQATGAWGGLAEVLATEVARTDDPDRGYALAMTLGRIQEDRLGDLAGAAEAYERATSTRVDPAVALVALDRVHARASNWAALADVLARQALEADDDVGAAGFLFRLGDLQESTLRAPVAALTAYRDVLARVPDHGGAISALERLMREAPAQRADIATVVEPVLEQAQQWARLYDVLALRHGDVVGVERSALSQRMLELAEQRLHDDGRAQRDALAWLADEPSSPDAIDAVIRVTARRRSHAEVAPQVVAVATAVAAQEPMVARDLWMRAGALWVDAGDSAAAVAPYQAALAVDAEALPVVEALSRTYRTLDRRRELADIEWRRGELAYEVPVKRDAFTEAAELREDLGDVAGAAMAWEEVLRLDEADRGALDRLARLYAQQGAREAWIETLRRTARVARDVTDEKAVRWQIAELEDQADPPARAALAWREVVDLDGADDRALAAWQAALTLQRDWAGVDEVLQRRLDAVGGAHAREAQLALHVARAQLAAGPRAAPADAIAAWTVVCELDPLHGEANAALEQALTAAGRHHDWVELLRRRAEAFAVRGDDDAEIATLLAAADVWEGPLDDADAASELVERVLARAPGSVSALTRLSRLAERRGDWDACARSLQQALALGPQGEAAAELFVRLGQVARRPEADDPTTAAQHYRQALLAVPDHPGALAGLIELARARGDHGELAQLMTRRLAMVGARAITGEPRVQALADVAALHQKAGAAAEAVAALREAVELAPTRIELVAHLADALVAADQLDQAAPLFDQLASEAKAARRMKDVARYRQRQGALLERRGDAAGALVALEEAFRINPTDVPTMAGLGRLYVAAKDWPKARRVYQSLVLQNFDADAGLHKAVVYAALGDIHREMGEPAKAKGMYQRGLELDPTNQRLREALAAIG